MGADFPNTVIDTSELLEPLSSLKRFVWLEHTRRKIYTDDRPLAWPKLPPSLVELELFAGMSLGDRSVGYRPHSHSC